MRLFKARPRHTSSWRNSKYENEITDNFNVSSYPTLENCLFGAVKLTKNADIDKYGYSGYGIGFDRHGRFSFMSSSTKIDNRKKDILKIVFN